MQKTILIKNIGSLLPELNKYKAKNHTAKMGKVSNATAGLG
jgi:hypothetical protein